MRLRKKPFLSNLLWLALLATLLWWALRHAPLADIWNSLKLLEPWQLAALLGLNIIIFALITLRWWLIVRAEARRVPFLPLVGFRLAAFAMSYFTPGPQVGGEPLQVVTLRRYGLTNTRAVAAVFMDKLLEFLANFLFLALGLVAVVRSGMLDQARIQFAWTAVPLGMLFAWPPLHILAMAFGRHPLSAAARPLQSRFAAAGPIHRFLRLVILSEHTAARFCRRRLGWMLASLAASLLTWAGMLAEYALMLDFLHLPLNGPQTLAALTLVRLSFLAPLPAGLGALEASQVFALAALGYPSAAAISLSLLMRGRDLLIGGVGLLLAGRGIGVK